ncbi:mechanosensitive ion channel protein [Rubrivivax gelatinosus]|uniref:mechanosensitive ion channel family protein n=1 Tax=Rubrivivax gelatinosus TaxID=28068 RepID=UPI0019071530|nr:mechanosensitive ion channel domain-containing protein [Rubrivivax gelatinosus]MBK1616615.1 mechanosensitive ion channel protein [Rubrivivax gelatinosus]
MVRSATADRLGQIFDSLRAPGALIELGIVVLCLALAWLLVRAIASRVQHDGSIWLGRRGVDGVLFPVLALLFAVAGEWILGDAVPRAVFRLAVPVLMSLVLIRLTVRVLQQAFPKSQMMRVVERSVSWIAWIGAVLWITGVLPLAMAELDAITWKVGSVKLSVGSVIEAIFNTSIVLVLTLWISQVLEQRLLKGAGDNLSVRKMASNLLRSLLLFVGLVLALSAAGIDLTALGVLGGAIGVGLGFGLQKLAANYVSGFVILAERSVRIGDMVTVDGFAGRITDINTRYTVIRALDGRESIVPNEMMIVQRVENSSLADARVALSTVVQVGYETDVEALMPKLVAAVAAVPRVLADPGPAVTLSAFASDGLELTIGFWIDDPHNGAGNVRSAVNLALLRTLNAEGVEIPFPQRVVRQVGDAAAD